MGTGLGGKSRGSRDHVCCGLGRRGVGRARWFSPETEKGREYYFIIEASELPLVVDPCILKNHGGGG